MRTHNIQFHNKIRKTSLYTCTCFLELSKEFRVDSKNEFELAMVNEPSVFEVLCFDCTLELHQTKGEVSRKYHSRFSVDRSKAVPLLQFFLVYTRLLHSQFCLTIVFFLAYSKNILSVTWEDCTSSLWHFLDNAVDSHYLEVQGTLWTT